MRHTFRETQSGLRRNMAVTIAVIITMSVSLSLSGVGLLTSMEVDLVRDRWYGKVEISVFLCVERSTGGTYEPGKAATGAQRKAIEEVLKTNPEVEKVFYKSKEEALKEFQRMFKDPPVLASRTAEQIQDSFRIKLLNPEDYKGMVNEAQGLQGVQSVRGLKSVLDPVFGTLDGLQQATIDMNVLLLLAMALQIPTTIWMTAFARRREVGIMRLVGASNFYILLSFLLESPIAGLIGALIPSGSIAITYLLLIEQTARPSIPAIVWIGADHVFNTIICVAMVDVALSVILTLLATRKYLRIWRVGRSRWIGPFPIYPETPSSIESPTVWLPRS